MPANKSLSRTLKIVMLAAVEVLLALTPLGYIPVGPVRATTIHIPVIIGGVLFGPGAGAVLGAVFGLTSLAVNTFTPTVTSFVFTPFYSVGEVGGNFWSLVIAMLPRILIGVVAALVYRALLKLGGHGLPACVGAGLCGSMTNTILVMGGIYLFFGQEYAAARGIAYGTLLKVIGGVIAVNGVVEAIVAAAIATAAIPVLKKALRE